MILMTKVNHKVFGECTVKTYDKPKDVCILQTNKGDKTCKISILEKLNLIEVINDCGKAEDEDKKIRKSFNRKIVEYRSGRKETITKSFMFDMIKEDKKIVRITNIK